MAKTNGSKNPRIRFLGVALVGRVPAGLLLLALLLLTGCQRIDTRPSLPEPLVTPVEEEDADYQTLAGAERVASDLQTGFRATPSVKPGPTVAGAEVKDDLPPLQGKAISVSLESLPLPAFINEIYGNMLGLSFELDPSLQKKTDLVTLRVTEPLPPADIYRMARSVLGSYGIQIQAEGSLLRFKYSRGTSSGEAPLLISGAALPDVPVSHRPVFQIVPLTSVRNTKVRGWLSQIYKGQGLEIGEDAERNAIVLQGGDDIVRQAGEAVRLLDQPTMRGRYSIRIEPVYQTPSELANALVDVLLAEGYGASTRPPMGSIMILPMDTINAVLAFAADRGVIDHVRQWAATLDQPSRTDGSEDNIFYYAVKHTRAADMAQTLSAMLGGVEKTGKVDRPAGKAAVVARRSGSVLVVDEGRNALVYQGAASVWAKLMPVIRVMDVPPKQVLIEVTIAEITLNEDEQFGVEWLVNKRHGGGDSSVFGTLGGLGIGGSGFSYTFASAGQTRFVLNALAENKRVNIVSTPRLMVKSGETANIDVGTEVPVVTSQSTAPDLNEGGPTSPSILQNIQYRKTGVLLEVAPVVHSGRRVDLEVSQELSAAEVNKTSGVDSPTILTRRVRTSLSLRDGGSVLLGGLIRTDATQNHSGVPVLMNLPVFGQLFRVDEASSIRTELLILIRPYILEGAETAESIAEGLISGFGATGETP